MVETIVGVLLAASLAACGDDTTTRDAGGDGGLIVSRPDAGPSFDSGPDAGPAPADAGADAGPSGAGAPCTTDADCTGAAGTCLTESDTGLPGGYCSAECLDDIECPHDAECVTIGKGLGNCFVVCDRASADACRRGYGCAPGDDPKRPDRGYCAPGCEADDDCETGQRCDRDGGFGGAGACYTVDAQIGDPCASDADCGMSGFCLASWPDGTCVTVGCDYDTNTGCSGDAQCLRPMRFALCIDGCTVDGDCRPGYACTIPVDTPERAHCAPAS